MIFYVVGPIWLSPQICPQRSGITQLNHLVGMLATHGVPMRLDYLYARRAPQRLSFENKEGVGKSNPSVDARRLAMGLQLLRLKRDRSHGKSAQVLHSRPAVQTRPAATDSDAPTARREVRTNDIPLPHPSPMPSHRQLSKVDLMSTGLPTERGFPPAYTLGDSDPCHGNGSHSVVVQEYLHTMEQFLNLQQEVMQAFLNGSQVATPPIPPREQIQAEKPTRLDTLQRPITTAPQNPAMAQTEVESELPLDQLEISPPEGALSSAQHSAEERAYTQGGSQFAPDGIAQTLLKLVSDRTGYPIEMLDLTLNLEADLGIDSIKRVEILGALQQQTGLLQAQDMDRASDLKTLQQIIDFLMKQERRDQGGADGSLPQQESSTPPLAPFDQILAFPFVGTIISFIPGQELVALRQIDLDEDLFLRDHTLGGRVSVSDRDLIALPVLPLTISMEMLAEAAAALLPGKLVVGMKDIRAGRWIALDDSRLTLELSARRNPSASELEIEVQIKEVSGPSTSEGQPGPCIIEGTVVFGESYPDPPQAGAFPLQSERPSRWTPEQLYPEVMFHGPSLQGVASVDRTGDDGTEGTLKALPTDRLFRSLPSPHFLTDPVLLDAAGQLVGFWTAEHLETGFHVFPFRVEGLHIYGTNLRQREQAEASPHRSYRRMAGSVGHRHSRT